MSAVQKVISMDPAHKGAKLLGRGLHKATGVTGFKELGDHASAAGAKPLDQSKEDWNKMTGKYPEEAPRAVKKPRYTGYGSV